MGYGTAIPFVEYLVGRRNGWYHPQRPPSYGINNGKSLRLKMEEEAENLFIRRVAESSFPSAGDPSYKAWVNTIKAYFSKRMNDMR